MKKNTAAVLFAALIVCAAQPAWAGTLFLPDLSHWTAVTVTVGGTSVTEYGGTATGATLNGQALDWIYCVERTVTVGVPGTYNATVVTDNGNVHDSYVSQAPQIAWLLDNYLSTARGSSQAQALQAAIWHVRDPTVSLTGNSDYDAIITALTNAGTGASGNVSYYAWLTPEPGTNQGLITHVPDGGATLMLLGGALVGLGALRRRFRA